MSGSPSLFVKNAIQHRCLFSHIFWREFKQSTETLGRTHLQNKHKNYRGPHDMHGAAQRVDNGEQQLDFLWKQWLDWERKLITVIQEIPQKK